MNLMSQSFKLSKEVIIGFCESQPMEMKYNLDDEQENKEKLTSYMKFYLAPKIVDE